MASKAGAGWNLAAVAAAMSAAAIDPSWGRAMDVISEQTGSVDAVLLPVDGLSHMGAAAKALGFARVDAALQAFEASGWIAERERASLDTTRWLSQRGRVGVFSRII
jgi:hypothetical protein